MLQAYNLKLYEKGDSGTGISEIVYFPNFFRTSFFEENLRASASEKQLPKLTEKVL